MAAQDGIDPSAAELIKGAVDALQRTAQLLKEEGAYRRALLEMAHAFDRLADARLAGAALGREELTTAEVVQFAVFEKLNAVDTRLGSKDPDVKIARQEFDAARESLRAGRLGEAIERFLRAYDSVEAAIAKARGLKATQAFVIVREAAAGLWGLREDVHEERMRLDNPAQHGQTLGSTLTILDRTPTWRLRSTAIGDLVSFRPLDSTRKVQQLVHYLKDSGAWTNNVQRRAFEAVRQLAARTADAVEFNIGPFDDAVVRARGFLAAATASAASGDYVGAVSSVAEALGSGLASQEVSTLQIFQPTGTDTACENPKVKVKPIAPVCLNPSASPPTEGGSTVLILTDVTTDAPGAFGTLRVTIRRFKGGQAIKQLEAPVITPDTVAVEWDGTDDQGNSMTFKGAAKQE
ncbi:MAG: hypothetical protein ACK44W_15410, partial [Planctomycetota bacterium]